MPQERRNEGTGKGGTYVKGTKDRRIYREGGPRGNGNQKGNACASDGLIRTVPYRAELRDGLASPASTTEKHRRRRPRLPGSGPEPPIVVAILLLGWAEVSDPFQCCAGLSRLPLAPSLWSSAPKPEVRVWGVSGSRDLG